jgi:hypothetical protein
MTGGEHGVLEGQGDSPRMEFLVTRENPNHRGLIFVVGFHPKFYKVGCIHSQIEGTLDDHQDCERTFLM